ncbi:GGDEF domain-containing protein [Galenea microaerophila]
MSQNTEDRASAIEKQPITSPVSRYHLANYETLKIAQQTLAEIQELDLNANPIHYTLFFEKIAQIDPNFSKEIENAIEQHLYNDEIAFKLFTELWLKLIKKLLPTQTIEGQLNTILQDIDLWFEHVEQHQQKIDRSLEKTRQHPLDPHLAKQLAIIEQGVSAIKAETRQLQQNIENSRDKIQSLKNELINANTLASTDELTNIPNLRGYRRMIENAIEYANQQGQTFALLLIDIDHFKQINDTYGHRVGDGVLRYLAKVLYRETKGRDYIARIGGEEFIVILPNTGYSAALKVANTIRKKIEQSALKVISQNQRLRLTVSIGIAIYRMGETEETLFERVDKALYLAKKDGRNRVKGETDL